MSNILIAGGGFAGVWSAAAAARVRQTNGTDFSITLVAPGDDLVIRPRLYQPNPLSMRMSLASILEPVGVTHLAATVTGLDHARRQATIVHRSGEVAELAYERLVLATGSSLVRPDLPGAEHLHDVDTIEAAAALEAHIRALPDGGPGPGQYTAVVVGAGFTGLEVATELIPRLREVADGRGAADQVRVVLVERADTVGPDLGPGPRPVILQALDDLGVERRLGIAPRVVDPSGVTLSDGSVVAARTVVWTAGMRASSLTAAIPGRHDRLGRLQVDAYLEVVGAPGVYAAGDTAVTPADPGGEHDVLQSCQYAGPLGKFAGHNVAADLLGLERAPFDAPSYVTCLDLGPAGAVFTTGFERTVRMTGDEAKQRKRNINERWIYPPAGDADALLDRADYRFVNKELRPGQARGTAGSVA
jgi:NADH:ubiquinone reductase (H+-translocating)